MQKILLIDDDTELTELLSKHFSELGYTAETAADGEAGLDMALKNRYQLVVLDVKMPKKNGFDVLKELRAQDDYIPVLMLTSQAEDADKVVGLELGADDYLSKPFSLPELRARVRALLRRIEALSDRALPEKEERVLSFGGLEINLDKRSVTVDDSPRSLTPLEFDMLTFLAGNPGRVFDREQIINDVWGYQISEYDSSINSLVRRLRAKIERDPLNPKFILTVRGVGYRFASPDEIGGKS